MRPFLNNFKYQFLLICIKKLENIVRIRRITTIRRRRKVSPTYLWNECETEPRLANVSNENWYVNSPTRFISDIRPDSLGKCAEPSN